MVSRRRYLCSINPCSSFQLQGEAEEYANTAGQASEELHTLSDLPTFRLLRKSRQGNMFKTSRQETSCTL